MQKPMNNISGTETSMPGCPASAGSEKNAAPASSSSLSGTRTSSNVYKRMNFIKSLKNKSSAIGSKLCSFWHPGKSSHAQTNGLTHPLPEGPEASAQAAPTSSSPDGIAAENLPPSADEQSNSSQNPILKKLELFKKFDTVEDHSGHYYAKKREPIIPSKKWVKRIAEEWRMLEKDLPDTVFVRIYEGRMDLMRAVIMGADGTPYHDGLFFFDVHFTSSYPNSPPRVKYRAHGLQINPNLYESGKVCLSLLGTWNGEGVEEWRPGKSNMLQVLVSIQGLVLNAEPYYNEPGFVKWEDENSINQSAISYSENAFVLSLRTMGITISNPPKYFEDLVNGHFYNRAHDILEACRAYLEGVEVGSYVKGKTVTAKGKSKTCSQLLKTNLPNNIKTLVEAFTKIGVKDCEKYLIPSSKTTLTVSPQ
ncbi:putative ubiquitin-conjugating enzyme E2 26 [Bienertia sinuspersici]